MRGIPKEVEPSSLLWIDDLSGAANELRNSCQLFSQTYDPRLLERWTRDAEKLLLADRPNDCAIVLIYIADCYHELNKPGPALDLSRKARRSFSHWPERKHQHNCAVAHYAVGLSYHLLGNDVEALRCYDEALKEFGEARDLWMREHRKDMSIQCDIAIRWLEQSRESLAHLRASSRLSYNVRIPILSPISAGKPLLALDHEAFDDWFESWVDVDAKTAKGVNFALRVQGDSMLGAGIRDGDIVLTEQRTDIPRNGQIVAIRLGQIDSEATIKRFYQEQDHIRLEPGNDMFPIVIIKPPSLPDAVIRARYARIHPNRTLEIYSGVECQILGWVRGSIAEGIIPAIPAYKDVALPMRAASEEIVRYGDAAFPTHTVVGQTEVVRVALTIEPNVDLSIGPVSEPEPDAREAMWVDVCLSASPADFALESPNVQVIKVPLDANSDAVIFKLVAQSLGDKRVTVEFFQNLRYLGRVELETIVGRHTKPSTLNSEQIPLKLTPSHLLSDAGGSPVEPPDSSAYPRLPPDLTILFDRVSVGWSRYCYRYRLLSYKEELALWFEEYQTRETILTPQGLLEETFAHLNRLHGEIANNETLFFERLSSIGTNLYGRLFPDDLKALYWNKIRDNVRSIVIISYEPWIPWELLHPFDPVTKQAEDGFLCEKFDLTRWLAGTAPPDAISLERLGLIVATAGLSATASEMAELKGLFGDKVEDISPSGEAVFQLLKTGGFSGLHFACHGKYNAKDPDWSNLHLAEGATLCPIDVDGDKLVFGKDRPLVFLNACETGRGGYALTGMGGWAEAFIRRANGSGFIGSTWEANDESAYKFAVAFYRHLLGGKTVAEAARLARLEIKRVGDPTWLSYTVYANPLARLDL